MSDFPVLKSGAVVQYPAVKRIGYSTRVMRFVDGAEQRFRQWAAPEKSWVIRLEDLDETEAQLLEAFFAEHQGSLDDFAFTDPWSGAEHSSCRIENSEMEFERLGENRVRTGIVIKENR